MAVNWSYHFFLLALAQALDTLVQVPAGSTLNWWQKGVIYQIYPRSFKDSDGDGIGDLNGITEQVDYLADLGVGAIWLSPIFQSPMADFGYDISDFREIDPIFGTLDDFIRLRDSYHARGIKLLLDLVPNHSSDEHEWFQKSVQNIAPYADYYVWAEPKQDPNGTRLPPSNWLSFFGGSAWTWNDARQAYYLHQFHEKQPDLNYRNPAVMLEMKDVIRFWLDLGVDGFIVDTVITLLEDERFLDEPRSFTEGIESDDIRYLNHTYTQNQPGSYDVIYEFRAVLDSYEDGSAKFMIVEAYASMESTMLWYGNGTARGASFPSNFLMLEELDRQSNASDFQKVIDKWYKFMPHDEWANWVIGNHDNPRAASRFGRDFMDSLHIIQFILPGTVVTYMGDEIAMKGAFIRWTETVDPWGLSFGKRRYKDLSRDPERAPFLWNSNVSAGFSTNQTTWLPVHPEYWTYNQVDQANKKSHLSVYKALLQLKSLPVIQQGSLSVKTYPDDILVIERFLEPETLYIAVVNLDAFYHTFDLSISLRDGQNQTWRVYISSLNCEHVEDEDIDVSSIKLRPKAGLVLTNQVAVVKDDSKSRNCSANFS